MITQNYIIPEPSLANLEKKVGKLNSKLAKANLEPIQLKIGSFFDETDDGTGNVVRLFNVTIEATEPEISGWQFVATLNHLSEGENVVLNISGQELPEMYRERGPVCDHCGFIRKRRDTYVVRNVVTGEHTQVGRTCLRDFLGNISAEKIADRAQWIADAMSLAEEAEKEKKEILGLPLVSRSRWALKTYLSFVAMTIRATGSYVSKQNAKLKGCASTASKAFDEMVAHCRYTFPTEADKQLADAAMEHFENIDNTTATLSEFDHNLNVIARTRFVEHKTLGYAAWMIPGYQRLLAKPASNHISEYVGTIGEKISLQVTVKRVTELDGEYGLSWLHVFEDLKGNELSWFCKTRAGVLDAGQTIGITGKVKQHREWNAKKQTVLTYVKKTGGK